MNENGNVIFNEEQKNERIQTLKKILKSPGWDFELKIVETKNRYDLTHLFFAKLMRSNNKTLRKAAEKIYKMDEKEIDKLIALLERNVP